MSAQNKLSYPQLKKRTADRRVIAVIPKLKELCESAEYMYSAPNSERHKPKKADISQYHYYLNKASFSELDKDAYVLIAVAERNTGEFFYDLDATDIETIDNIEGTTDTLVATRVPNSEQQGSVPKSRIQNLKEFVNHWEQVFSNNPTTFSIQAAALPDRFACPIKIDNQIAFALLTLKRTDGNKLYSIELEEINQLGGTLDRLKHLLKEEPSTIPLRANVVIVAELFAKDKEYFGENAYRSIFANTADANFSIAALAPGGRFQSNPLAECMSNFMRTEARRYERTLSKQTPGDAAANVLFATQSIIHAVDKYVQNGAFKLPRESMARLKHARALIDKYAQMMKSGKVRSFNKIDKAERAEQAILSAIEKAYSNGIFSKEAAQAFFCKIPVIGAKHACELG